jgi:endoplasmic reticulum junction formation protein lunapark
MNAAASRYALICQKCLSHNGLVKEYMWEDARTHELYSSYQTTLMRMIEYVCPKCGHFNPSARSQRKDFQSQQQSSTMHTPARSQHGGSPQSTLQVPNRVDGSPGSDDSTTKLDS